MTKRQTLADTLSAAQSQDTPHAIGTPQAEAGTVELMAIITGHAVLTGKRFRLSDVNFPADQFVGTLGEAVEAGWQIGPDSMDALTDLGIGKEYEYDSPDGKRIKVVAESDGEDDDRDDYDD